MADSVKARLVGMNHVALEVGSIDEALEFYGTVFDLSLRGRLPRMAFVDMGDQFLALAEGRSQEPDGRRHLGLVVDDKDRALELALSAGAKHLGGHDILDPWGNFIQLVSYRDVQFTKAPQVLRGMGLDGLEKSDAAAAELREKGLG
jgi:catechol 2,3-dioxygenase-like lactoylglutathione lyase family enzyme